MKIAIPTNKPGGISSVRSAHFGHCDVFTIIDLSDKNEIQEVATLENGGHEAGGCMKPVSLLKDAGVEAIVVSGLGMRPMQGFSQQGIIVYYANQDNVPDVESVVESLREGKLVVMHPDQVCRGGVNCSH